MLIEILNIMDGLISLIFDGDLQLCSAVAASNKFKICVHYFYCQKLT
jgi:hypothetical protein